MPSPIINGIYTKDFPSLGRDGLLTDLIPVAITGDNVTYVATLDDLMALYALAGATFTLGSTSIALGSVTTTVAGLTSVTSTTFVGALTGNATTATTATNVALGGITGLGTGVGTALAVNVGSAGAVVLFNGAGGTPSSMTGTNISGTASGLTAGNVTTNANLTGPITSVGNATSIASQTGTGTTFAMSAAPALTGAVTIGSTGSLAITNTAGASQIMLALANLGNGVGTGAKLNFLVSATSSVTGQIEAIRTGTGNTGNTDLVFKLADGSAASEKARLTSAGGLSITGAYTSTLATGDIFLNTAAGTGLKTFNIASDGANLVFGVNNSTGSGVLTTNNYASYLFTHNATDLVFGTNDVVRMTLGSAGAINVPGLTASQLVQTDASKNLVSSNTLPASVSLTTPAFTGVPTGTVTSGSSTPTYTNVSNIDSNTPASYHWIRVGNEVTVTGSVSIDATLTATDTVLGISLPVASDFTTPEDSKGICVQSTVTAGGQGYVTADATNNRVELHYFAADVGGDVRTDYTFTYIVK